MGNSQSKPRSEHALQRELTKRVRELELERARLPALQEKSLQIPAESSEPNVIIDATEQWQEELLADPKNRLAIRAFEKNTPEQLLKSRATTISDTQIFNIKLPLEGSPVTDQKVSGRCWLFATTNVFRIALMKKYNLDTFELSQAYLFFWDKLEKSNYFYESIIKTADESLDSRLLQSLLSSPIGDGGQWDMAANLVQKYGIVPHSLYPDAVNAESSSSMGRLITTKLKRDALRLRSLISNAASADELGKEKQKMLQEVHMMLTLMLGPPPSPVKDFTWAYYDKAGAFHSVTTTPKAFAEQLSTLKAIKTGSGWDFHKLFSLVHDPRNPYYRLLTVDYLGNVSEGRPITYVNVPMTVMKDACIAMLKQGIPVFFGSDVSKYSDSIEGIMDTKLFDYELAFNVHLGMTKAERLETGISAMNHAMVLTAVHVEDEKPVRWRVENSWSKERGDQGYFVMSDEWMDEYVYQAVVDPSFVSKEIRDVLKQDPIRLPPWDPLGALAD